MDGRLGGPTMVGTKSKWEDELGRWLRPFLDRLGHKARRRMCPLYISGLIGPGDRKSVQPMAARLAPGEYAQLQAQGQSVLDSLAQTRLDTLCRFEQDLSAPNGRWQRAYRLPVQDIAGQFLVSDLRYSDQAATSATVRADSSSVTLRDRSRPAEATIQSTQFSTSDGPIEQFSGMYRPWRPARAASPRSPSRRSEE